MVSFVLTLSFGFADHAPSPHGVRIAVAAPAGFVQELATGLAHAAPGGFTVVAAPSALAAIGSVRLFLLGRRFRLWWRVAAAVLFALLAACASVIVLDAIFGALTGASAALIGVGFLGSLTFVAFVTACQAVTGLPGTGLAALAFVFIGNAVSGGTVPFAFLPGGFRQLAPWLPNGAIVSAARGVVYLPESNPGHPLLVLGIWLAGSLAVLACVDLLHLAERRHAPERKGEIYATPGTTQVRQRLALRRAAAPETASRA